MLRTGQPGFRWYDGLAVEHAAPWPARPRACVDAPVAGSDVRSASSAPGRSPSAKASRGRRATTMAPGCPTSASWRSIDGVAAAAAAAAASEAEACAPAAPVHATAPRTRRDGGGSKAAAMPSSSLSQALGSAAAARLNPQPGRRLRAAPARPPPPRPACGMQGTST